MSITTNYETIFSDYDIPYASTKFEGVSETAIVYDTVGSADYATETKVVKKNKRNLDWKQSVRGASGKLTLSLHMPMEIATKAFDMTKSTLKSGVRCYGVNSKHPYFSQTLLLEDEDGNLMLAHFPKCKITSGFARTVTANGEEVAETSIEVTTLPDEYGNMYYDLATESGSSDIDTWMSNWTYNSCAKA